MTRTLMTRTLAVALVAALSACSKRGSGDLSRFLASPTGCTSLAQCKEREVCTDGFCTNPAPTSTSYVACSLDPDCPGKDYCSLGACGHDCVTDKDCSSGLVCTSRGRCADLAKVDQPAPVEAPAAPSLEVSTGTPTDALTFARGVDQLTFTLRSSNGSPIKYRILSDQAWLSAEPSSGEVKGDPVTVTLKVDRSVVSTTGTAGLAINSTGGAKRLAIFLARDLTGRYAGTIRIAQPYAIGSSTLNVQLFDAGDGSLTGYVEPDGAALFPARSKLEQGKVHGDEVTFRFKINHLQGGDANPWLKRNVRRTVTLQGKVSSFGTIAGTFRDDLEGILDEPIALQGSFVLERGGGATQGEGEPAAAIQLTPVKSSFTQNDNQCGRPAPDAASQYLRGAAPFYDWFATVREGASPFAGLGTGQATMDPARLRCAQFFYDSLAEAAPIEPTYMAGLLDALEVMADHALLFGNQKIVEAFEAWRTPGRLEDELVPLNQAASLFVAASHPATATAPLTLLDPSLATFVIRNAASATVQSGVSTLETNLVARGSYEHLRRQLLTTGGVLRAHLEIAKRMHRLGQTREAAALAKRASLGVYLDLALLGAILKAAGAADLPEVTQVAAGFDALVHEYALIASGENPVGLAVNYVRFLLDPRDPGTNYRQVWITAVSRYNSMAKGALEQARSSGRDFENSEAALELQVLSQNSQIGQQLTTLCGSEDPDDCTVNTRTACQLGVMSGLPVELGAVVTLTEAVNRMCPWQSLKPLKEGSDIATAVQEAAIAAQRVTEARNRVNNLIQEQKILQNRYNEVSGVYQGQITLINLDGLALKSFADREKTVDDVVGTLNNIAETIQAASAAGMSNPWAVGGAVTAGALREVALLYGNYEKEKLAEDRIDLETTERAQALAMQQSIDQQNITAEWKAKELELCNLQIERDIAIGAMAAATGKVIGIQDRAKYLKVERERLRSLEHRDLRRLLQYRTYATQLEMAAQDAFDELMRWAYLATRAAEYELNATYARTGDLWRARDADQINTYLQLLDDFYQDQKPLAPQYPVDVFSLRDDILDLGTTVTDPVTGQAIEPRERFRRFVADPTNRDMDGNLRIVFSTVRPDKVFFAKTVCNDRVRSVRVNLVGDHLGTGVTAAYVSLLQGGVNYLRSCGDLSKLVPYDLSLSGKDAKHRTARVEAGVNASNRLAAGQPNTDFVLRSVLADSWELVIDTRKDVEPANAKLDLTGLDDIEMIVEQEAYTGQTR